MRVHAAAVALAVAGCTVGRDVGQPRLVALDAASLAVPAAAAGAVFTLRVSNPGTSPVEVADVTTKADPALDVEVLGLTDCSTGCAGSAVLDAEVVAEARASVAGGPREVPPDRAGRRLSIVVVLRLRPGADRGACAYLRSLLFGGVELATRTGEHLAAVGPEDEPCG